MTVWVLSRGILLDNGRGRPVKAGMVALDILFSSIWSPERRWPQRAAGAPAVEGECPVTGESSVPSDSPRPLRLSALRRIRRPA